MKAFSFKEVIVFLTFHLVFFISNAQPNHYDYIKADENDTLWVSHTDNNGNTSDYYLYFWWHLKNYTSSREKHAFKAEVVRNDGTWSESSWVYTSLFLKNPPAVVTIGPLKKNYTFRIREKDWNVNIWGYAKDEVFSYRLPIKVETSRYTLFPPQNLEVENNGMH